MKYWKIWLPLVSLSLFSPLAIAQNNPSAQTASKAALFFYQPKSSPVRIVSYSHGTSDLIASVLVENVSDRPIQSVEFEWMAESPGPCVSDGVDKIVDHGRLGPFSIPLQIGHAKHLHNLGLKQDYWKLFSAAGGVSYVDVEVVPSRIVFSDGTLWTHDLNLRKSYDPKTVHLLSQFCVNGALLPSAATVEHIRRVSPLLLASLELPSAEFPLKLRRIAQYDSDGGCSDDGDCDGGGDGDYPDPVVDDGGDGGGDDGGDYSTSPICVNIGSSNPTAPLSTCTTNPSTGGCSLVPCGGKVKNGCQVWTCGTSN